MIILAGSSHPEFVDLLCNSLCIPKGDAKISKFANGELSVDITVSVRDQDVYIVQSGFEDVNDLVMELMIMIHACQISSAKRVVAVLPYFPYAKQISSISFEQTPSPMKGGPRRQSQPKLSIDLKENPEYTVWPVQTNTLIANLMTTAGADHFITMDLHDPQFQGFFDDPLENLPSLPLMARCINQIGSTPLDSILVSPDAGGAKRTALLAEAVGFDFALVHQDRRTGSHSDTSILIGSVTGKTAILVDDIADTCETLINAAELLDSRGASKVIAIVTHGLFSKNALDRIGMSKISELYVSNTIPQCNHAERSKKIRVYDVSCMFAEAIRRIHNGESVSYLFRPNSFY